MPSLLLVPVSSCRKLLATSVATLLAVCAFSLPHAKAAIVVASGGVTETFDVVPPVENWSTTTAPGNAGTTTTPDQLDASVSLLSAASIADPLGDTGVSPPAAGPLAQYDSVLKNVQTRPTGVNFVPLLATLQNGSGAPAGTLDLNYELGANAPLAEQTELRGHRVYFSLDGTTWNNIPQLSGIDTPGPLSATVDLGGTWADGALLYVLWADDNGPSSPDTGFTLDTVHFVPKPALPPGKNLVYNLAHTVGGAPNGNLDLSGNNYFLDGANPAAFANNDTVNFSQDGTANINVPADVAPKATRVSAATGTYTIGGAGKIAGTFTKENAGTLVLTSANSFTSATITGGTVETKASGALGLAGVNISGGAVWKVKDTAQTQNGALNVTTGGATIQTGKELESTDLTMAVIDGDGALTKTGLGTLFLTTEPGTGSGGLNIQAGKVSTAQPGGLGNNQNVTLHNTTIEFTNATDRTFSDATRLRTINVGTEGGTIAVTAPGALIPGTVGITVNNADSITGSGTITKTGDGVLRMRAEHAGLTSNWVINGGTLEYSTLTGAGAAPLTNAIGSGTVTVNTGGRFGVQGGPDAATLNVAPNNITLNGGALGVRTTDFSGFSGTVNVVAPSAVDVFSFSTPDNALSAKLTGVLSGAGNLAVTGPATATAPNSKALVLTNLGNTYTGTMTVGAGAGLAGTGRTLGAVDVNALGTLGAGSDVAAATFGPGVFSIGGNLTLAAEAAFVVDLAGADPSPVAGINYDRVVVGTGSGAANTGQIRLGGSRLGLTLGTGIKTNDLFFIMTNDGVDPVIGTFADYVDNQEFTDPTSGQIFRISYNADEATNAFNSVTGNDIALIAVPEPGSTALLALGSALLLRRRRNG